MKIETHHIASRMGFTETRTETYYKGSATITSPVPDHPWSWTELHFECTHRHADYDKAHDCGQKLAARKARELNKATAAANTGRPCDRQVAAYRMGFGDPDQFIAWCAAHHTAATTLHPVREAAETDPWVCPWAAA